MNTEIKNFTEIEFSSSFEYSSDSERLPIEFYLQVFPKSNSAYLKLGYFSSSAIRLLAYGFAKFIHNGGTIKIITNHFLYENDQVLLNSMNNSEDLTDKFLSDLKWLTDSLCSESEQFFNCLRYLVDHERIEIIPVMLLPNKMSHYKQGIFFDHDSNCIFMDGSCNFTASGLLENGECISIYRSWGTDFEINKVEEKKKDILEICGKLSNKYIYLDKDRIVSSISAIGKEKSVRELMEDESRLFENVKVLTPSILQAYKEEISAALAMEFQSSRLLIPNWLNYREGDYSHQGEAVDAWLSNEKRGTLEIATGGGKTLTSLVCASIALQFSEKALLIISVPNKPLIKQWSEDVRNFCIEAIDTEGMGTKNIVRCIRKITKQHEVFPSHSVIIMTHDAIKNSDVKNVLEKYSGNLMLIGDEAHNLGSESFTESPPNFIKIRLALSATPERQYDPEGTIKLFQYFGDVVYRFTLEQAIGKCLVPFQYKAHKVYLNQKESDEWIEYTEKIKKLSWNKDEDAKKLVEQYKIRRRAISEAASEKNDEFRLEVSKMKDRVHSLAFCTDKSPEQIIDVNDILRDEGLLFHQVTGEETSSQKLMFSLVESYKKGEIEILTSKRVLDEGFNIPAIKTAFFLASSGTTRTWVQRLGRVLRKSEDTGKKIAVVHDFIVFPVEISSDFRSLLNSELNRMQWFMNLAMKDSSLAEAIVLSDELITLLEEI